MHPVSWIEGLAYSPALLIVTIGFIALAESLAVIGLLVPGVLLLTVAASVAGHADISIVALLISSMIGAVIGDSLSFWLGHSQHERIPSLWPFNRHPEWLSRGQAFFERYGILSIAFGRFVGPVRPIIPLVAGMLHMPKARFLTINIISALIWAPVYLLPGYYLGQAWQKQIDLPPGSEKWFLELFTLLVIAALTFSWLRRRLDRNGRFYRSALHWARKREWRRRLWLAFSQRFTGGEFPLASLMLGIGSLWLFVGWTAYVISHADQPLVLDLQSKAIFASLATHHLIAEYGLFMDFLGDKLGIVALVLPWLLWMLWQRYYAAFIHWAMALGIIGLLNTVLKYSIGRPRPMTPDHLIGSFSYPSAHASGAMVMYGLAAAFIAQNQSSGARRWPYWGAILIIITISISRLAYGVHWASDLIGGVLLGLVVCALIRISYHRFSQTPLAFKPWPWLLLGSVLLFLARMTLLPRV
ncbi:bifunctional DedA family/phosphatase PAP2 family protein [Phytohalomonas tamaricis]|uniref:bifunctional DedA family/phosphatase PAP2 family protein n=1 Tax=Phytohalomonas tamaricis TaxID=2081032 RepID=UPI000D0B37A6|nr:bifunctional DedA family/phosphatase PAP2 family protein [Phytohalomonas tamaricis]